MTKEMTRQDMVKLLRHDLSLRDSSTWISTGGWMDQPSWASLRVEFIREPYYYSIDAPSLIPTGKLRQYVDRDKL